MKGSIKHVAIAGNIGAGKTSLTRLLSKHFGWEAHYEDADDNPYLSDFYGHMDRWAFNLQIYFLNSRFSQLQQIQSGDITVIQDRTIYEDAHIFASNLHEMGLLESRDFKTYQDIFSTLVQFVKPPDLLIYLKAEIPKLVSNIHDRGRDYEGNMSLDYLKKLNQRYDNWIEGYQEGRLLIIDVNETDFVHNAEDFGEIVHRINLELNGLF